MRQRVHGEGALDLRVAQLLHVLARYDPSVVDENVNGARLGHDTARGVVYGGAVSDVAVIGAHSTAPLAQPLSDRLEAGVVDVPEDDVCRPRGQSLGQRASDAAGGSGDDDVSSGKTGHVDPPPDTIGVLASDLVRPQIGWQTMSRTTPTRIDGARS
jgi:hypothetical protein